MNTTRHAEAQGGLYPGLLGASWLELDPTIRRAHRAGDVFHGQFTMRYGTGAAVAFLRRALRLPPPGRVHDARLMITRDAQGERWARTIGARSLVTIQRALPDGTLGERLGVAELRFRLHAEGRALRYAPAGAALTLGRWSMPLPRVLAPRVEAREEPADGRGSRVHVMICLPMIGLFLSYEGTVAPEAA
jgi:hypothetical protein